MKTIRIAAGQGFWGDSLEAPVNQVTGGDIDYLMLDYLAEVTMSITRIISLIGRPQLPISLARHRVYRKFAQVNFVKFFVFVQFRCVSIVKRAA